MWAAADLDSIATSLDNGVLTVRFWKLAPNQIKGTRRRRPPPRCRLRPVAPRAADALLDAATSCVGPQDCHAGARAQGCRHPDAHAGRRHYDAQRRCIS
ncbi:Os04g0250450 [Oryza sativa Japonica Group]|uniref:Os04g0250450 protein n=1 Tax=Oryza sativa subsp. japonica TaxID=39947 RepID=A0A0N7KIQ4_ORYSJ|nr:Os04g0250450 [Oryza sativa Japonica Group]